MSRRNKHVAGAPGRAGRGEPAQTRQSFGPSPSGRGRGHGPPNWLAILILAIVCVAVYFNSLHGEFVYDDTKQITGNELIQQNRYFGRALTSDVWAFKGDTGEAWSNYWRPAFMLWLIINHRLFGLESTVGWHATSIALHALVCALAYLLLRKLGLTFAIALAIGLIFAVHPVHVESVAWISGSCDLIFAATILGSMLLIFPGPASPLALAGSLGLFAVALLSKEPAVLYPAIVFTAALVLGRTARESIADGLRRALRFTVPFLVTAAAYVLVHLAVIGKTQITTRWSGGITGLILAAPSVLWFYLRQALFPIGIGPAHTLRPVSTANAGMGNFLLPLIASAVVMLGLLALSRRHPIRWIGLAIFVFSLAPAFNINAFIPEHIVQDRYLYLPLLGLLMILIPALADGLSGVGQGSEARGAARAASPAPGTVSEQWTLGAVVLLSIPLSIATIRYNPVWGSERALWTAALAADPGSATNLSEYGRILFEANKLKEARAALDRALTIQPITTAYLLRGEIATRERRFADAEADLKLVLGSLSDNMLAYERLAVVYQDWGRLADAEALLRTARERVPHARGAFTDSLSITLYLQGKKDEALRELEAARPLARTEFGTSATWVLFHLGSLYAEAGRKDEARKALTEFLEVSRNDRSPATQNQRTQAQTLLSTLAP